MQQRAALFPELPEGFKNIAHSSKSEVVHCSIVAQIRSGRAQRLSGALGSLWDPFWGLEEWFSVWLQRECGFLGTKP